MCNCDSDHKEVMNMQSEVYCEVYNNPDILVNTETSDSASDNIMQSLDQPQNTIDEVQIKHEVVSDSDIEVDLAYRIIDTFNVGEVKTFKLEGEKISPFTETSLKIEFQNDHKRTQSKVEVDYEMANDLKVSCKEEISIIKGNVDCENLTSKDYVNKKPVHQLLSKGM